jgi:hypothetical protein
MTIYTTRPDPMWPDIHTAIYKGNQHIGTVPHGKVQEQIDHHERIREKHWSGIAMFKDDRQVFANGTAYRIGSPDDNPRGFGGSVWLIKFFDGREVRCNSLWCLGDIPADWRDRLPDNATLKEIGYEPR